MFRRGRWLVNSAGSFILNNKVSNRNYSTTIEESRVETMKRRTKGITEKRKRDDWWSANSPLLAPLEEGSIGVKDKHFASLLQASWGRSHTVTETMEIKYWNRLSSCPEHSKLLPFNHIYTWLLDHPITINLINMIISWVVHRQGTHSWVSWLWWWCFACYMSSSQ